MPPRKNIIPNASMYILLSCCGVAHEGVTPKVFLLVWRPGSVSWPLAASPDAGVSYPGCTPDAHALCTPKQLIQLLPVDVNVHSFWMHSTSHPHLDTKFCRHRGWIPSWPWKAAVGDYCLQKHPRIRSLIKDLLDCLHTRHPPTICLKIQMIMTICKWHLWRAPYGILQREVMYPMPLLFLQNPNQ